ncbi:SEN34 subunit of tRNA-splicing endonuclease [Xylariaceae sp. FL0016]|nr:SEN34 subunit of tRNA-splicing endonuclease [Xylariaceae sp. FL0016]
MASAADRPFLRISKVAGRYLLFDIDDVMYLRRTHNICSVFVGTIPQNPSQNTFMGLPLELMPEEAQVLVNKKVAYVVDDAAFHVSRLTSMDVAARKAYLQPLKHEGKQAQLAIMEENKRAQVARQHGKSEKSKRRRKAGASEEPESSTTDSSTPTTTASLDPGTSLKEDEEEVSLFDSSPIPRKPPNAPHAGAVPPVQSLLVTPTTSSLLTHPPPSASPPDTPSPAPVPEPTAPVELPPSYPLYAHLQDRGYYMMPGLRFGCDYNVYPGDPLRFHSHFQATHYGWEDEISMLDLVGGGRLGTNVKKGYLIGGAVGATDVSSGDGNGSGSGIAGDDVSERGKGSGDGSLGPPVRTFCIEWAGI